MQGITGRPAVQFGDPGLEPGLCAETIAPADRRVEERRRLAFGGGESGDHAGEQFRIGGQRAAYQQILHGAALCRRACGEASAAPAAPRS